MQGCLAVSVDGIRIRPQGEEAFSAFELTIDYRKVKRSAIEDVLVVNVEAELSLSKHHQRESPPVYLGRTVQSIQPRLRYLLRVCLELNEDEVDDCDVPREDSEMERFVALARLAIVDKLEAAVLII